MIEKSELLRVPAFEGLPDDQLDWFISQTRGDKAEAGRCVFATGGSRGARWW